VFVNLVSLVQFVNVAVFLKIHFTRMMGNICRGVLFKVYVECV